MARFLVVVDLHDQETGKRVSSGTAETDAETSHDLGKAAYLAAVTMDVSGDSKCIEQLDTPSHLQTGMGEPSAA